MLMMKNIYMKLVRVMAVAAVALGLSSCLEKIVVLQIYKNKRIFARYEPL